MDNLLKSENPILNVKTLASDLFFETYTNTCGASLPIDIYLLR